jgi:hypothetical protein
MVQSAMYSGCHIQSYNSLINVLTYSVRVWIDPFIVTQPDNACDLMLHG